ncbi:MAG: o-succinylbenzoate synthase [FCB group bacterium]|nr:o-succinylbenzoate synthase [FCB group bacterium]
MDIELRWARYRLIFKTPAETSRSILTTHQITVLQLRDIKTGTVGWGEVAPLPGLSPDDPDSTERWLLENTAINPETVLNTIQDNCPALRFGVEMALRELSASRPHILFPGPFTEGREGIPINGLVWMDEIPEMERQFRSKIEAGFTCLKMKIGARDIQEELKLLSRIRSDYDDLNLEIRVDANGAFSRDTVFPVLEKLAELDIHSIEQPLSPDDLTGLAEVCARSPIPIALDESCIGLNETSDRIRLLDEVNPAFIILKPTLLGGFSPCESWIELAKERNIGWWVTSALESNLGLNAIAQWTATLSVIRPQGLGTGMLYTNNFSSPLTIQGEKLWMNPKIHWDEKQFAAVIRG